MDGHEAEQGTLNRLAAGVGEGTERNCEAQPHFPLRAPIPYNTPDALSSPHTENPMKIARTPAFLALAPAFALALAPTTTLDAQERIPSPRGEAATQVGGSYEGSSYTGGSWIVVDYGRPITRGRDVFGSGDDYGRMITTGAVWRLGANQSTRFMTEADLMFGDQRLPAGEYTIFADLGEDEWTLIFSNWGAKQSGREDNPDALWGSYGYTADRDVLRTTMEVESAAMSSDQMVILFTDMTSNGGNFTVWWDDQVAMTPFSLAR